MLDNPPPALVLGLGNTLMRDDAAGIAAVHRLQQRFVTPPQVDLVDGGTMGLYLIDRVSRYDRLLVVDSIALDEPPGTLVRLEGRDVDAAFSTSLSPHQAGLSDLLAALALMGRRPPQLVMLGIVPSDVSVGTSMTPTVAARLDTLVDRVADELKAWGYPVTPTPGPSDAARRR